MSEINAPTAIAAVTNYYLHEAIPDKFVGDPNGRVVSIDPPTPLKQITCIINFSHSEKSINFMLELAKTFLKDGTKVILVKKDAQ